MSVFTEVSVIVDGEAAEAVADALLPFAYQAGVVLEQLGDENDPNPTAMESLVTVKIFIPQDEDTEALRQRIREILYHLNRLYPIPAPNFRLLKETDWANAWKDHYHPFRIGDKFWIQPSWHKTESDDQEFQDRQKSEDLLIVLDPGMAFGTGLHPTTQMCMKALEKVVLSGDSVLDVGTGSGILSIAAVKLGAGQVVGVDTDELAVKSAIENAELNHSSNLTSFWQGGLETVKERGWQVVVVNILAPVIIKLLNEADLMAYMAEQGWLILSGIIDSQFDELEKTIRSVGGTISEKMVVRDWVTLLVRSGAVN